MARIALLSNPRSTGNRALLPRVRSFCAEHPEIFHYEVESVDQIGPALQTIARVKPLVLVINGGDGTVQTTLTELYHGEHFGLTPPPVAVLPNGKTNLIALDLGSVGDPVEALERVLEIARGPMDDNIVSRELIALSREGDVRPVLGMFLGGAGLAETILYCRHKIYPLGLPNGISHLLTVLALVASLVLGISAAFLPNRSGAMKISLIRQGQFQGHFSLLIVTTLRKMLLGSKVVDASTELGALQLMVVEQNLLALLRAMAVSVVGRAGSSRVQGVHFERGDEIRIEGRSSVVFDGEIFHSGVGNPITLRHTDPIPFLRLAA